VPKRRSWYRSGFPGQAVELLGFQANRAAIAAGPALRSVRSARRSAPASIRLKCPGIQSLTGAAGSDPRRSGMASCW